MEDEPVPSPEGTAPPRPEKLTVDFYEQPDGLAVQRKRGGGPWFFLLIWLIGWTVGCVFLAFMVIGKPTFGSFAFAVPFWASWLFVAGLLAWMLFGRETLLLRADEAMFVRTAIVRLSSRVVPRAEIRGFRECQSSHTENDEHLWGIEMVTLGKPLRFAFRLPDRERAWLLHQLNAYLDRTAPSGGSEAVRLTAEERGSMDAAADDADSEDTASVGADNDDAETLDYEHTLANPPTDSDWRFLDDVDDFTFLQRGRLHLGSLGLLLFINLFWNGIVTVFILVLLGQMPGGDMPGGNVPGGNAPKGGEWWGLFFFLIPFELIGLGMFVALVAVALEPLRRTIWRFERYRIVRHWKWPIFRRTRAWDIATLDRLELRRGRGTRTRRRRGANTMEELTAQPHFALAFVSTENADVCEIDNLTEGEARWIARTVFERRRKWFD